MVVIWTSVFIYAAVRFSTEDRQQRHFAPELLQYPNMQTSKIKNTHIAIKSQVFFI